LLPFVPLRDHALHTAASLGAQIHSLRSDPFGLRAFEGDFFADVEARASVMRGERSARR